MKNIVLIEDYREHESKLFEALQELTANLKQGAPEPRGNHIKMVKTAQARARKASLMLGKMLPEFRKKSIAMSKFKPE